MNTQILTFPVITCNFAIAPLEPNLSLENPVYASSRDYGFDFDEEEQARELLAPLPTALASPAIPEVDADEFEQVFQFYLS
jgi:hypothetical protein